MLICQVVVFISAVIACVGTFVFSILAVKIDYDHALGYFLLMLSWVSAVAMVILKYSGAFSLLF